MSNFTTFRLLNFAAKQTSGRARFCLLFAKGNVPKGKVPQIGYAGGIVPAQFDERATAWKDGSAKLMVCSLRASNFGPNEEREFTVSAVSGQYNNTPSLELADLLDLHDFRLHFTNVTQSNDVETVQRGCGTFTASLRDFAQVPTRVKTYHSGPLCMSWRIWGLAKEDEPTSGSGEDPDLKVTFYVTAHLNADGSVADVEHSAKISQDWWDAPYKCRLNYDAAYYDGDAFIEKYLNIQHPYHSGWRTLRLDNDANHARPFWVKDIPTLVYEPDKNYWVKTNIIPPLDTTFTPSTCWQVGYRSNYLPLSPQDHGGAPGTAGSHPGRGLVPNMDAIRFMTPTPDNSRRARTNAEAGWGIPYHYKSMAMRKRPGETVEDIADTTIAMIMRPMPASNYDFCSKGMPAAIDAYSGRCQSNIAQSYTEKTGGNGYWTPQAEASHAVSYSFMTYLFEGDRATMECALELATNLNHQQAGTMHSGCPIYFYSDAGGVPGLRAYTQALNIPPTQYSGLGSSRWVQNFRAIAWDMNISCHAALICPENDEQCGSMQTFFRQRCVYHASNLPYLAQSQKAQGLWSQWVTSRYVVSPWMMSFIGQAFPYAALAMEDQNLTNVILKCTQYYPIAQWEGDTPYRAEDYRELVLLKPNDDYDPQTNAFLPRTRVLKLAYYKPTATGGIDVSAGSVGMPFTNGDVIYFPTTNEHGDLVPLPVGVKEAQPYYAVNSSGLTCQVAATAGGKPIKIVWPDLKATYAIAYQPQAWKRYPVMSPGVLTIRADDYAPMSHAALIATSRVPGNAVTPKLLAAAARFLTPVNYSNFVSWKFAVPPKTQTTQAVKDIAHAEGERRANYAPRRVVASSRQRARRAS